MGAALQLAVISMVLLLRRVQNETRSSSKGNVTLSALFSSYTQLCHKHSLHSMCIDKSDFINLWYNPLCSMD